MALIDLDIASRKIGITRNALNKIIKNGKELTMQKNGRKNAVDEVELDSWLDLKKQRTISLSREDFLTALKFALRINYAGHTRTDFGTVRQRTFMQAVENWTQGALAEIALQQFFKNKIVI